MKRAATPHRIEWPRVAAAGLLLVAALGVAQWILRAPMAEGFAAGVAAWQQALAGGSPYGAENGAFYGAPALLGFFASIPPVPEEAWKVFAGASVFSLAAALWVGARYRSWRSLITLVAGLILGVAGIAEALRHAQFEPFIFLLGVLAARLYAFWPATAGFLLGLMPAFKLSWMLFFLPFVLRALSHREVPYPKNRFYRRLMSGYFLAFFSWAAAIPSLLFGPERAKTLSQEWVQTLAVQPQALDVQAANHSLLGVATRLLGISPERPEWVLAFVLIVGGILLGVLMRKSRGFWSEHGVMAWIAPWFLFTELVSPMASRCGSLFAAGAVFGATRKKVVVLVLLLWVLQFFPEMHRFGVVTLYWLALIFV